MGDICEYLFFPSFSVPIWIGTPELHVWETCLLFEMNNMVQQVNTTFRLHDLHICVWG